MRKRRRWNIKNKTTNQIAECGMFECECKSFKLISRKRIECAYCGTSYPLSGIEEIYNVIPNTLGRYPYRNKRLKRIDDYFNNLTTEEFEEKLINNGINEIKPASEDGFFLSFRDKEILHESKSVLISTIAKKFKIYEILDWLNERLG